MFVFNKWVLPLAVLAAVAVAQQPDASHHDMTLPGAETAAADPAPAYGGGKQPANEYRYDDSELASQWNQQGGAGAQQSWYHQPAQGNKQVQGYGPQQGGQGQRNGAQRRRDGQGQGQGQGQGNKQGNRRQQQVAQRPQQPANADYYDDYDTAEGSSGFSLMEYVPQSLRRVFSGVSSWMSRMDGSTVVTGALTAFALGIAAAMGTAGLSGVAVTGRQIADRFDLSWDKFKEIQKLDAVSRALDFLEIEDEICRQKAVCEVEQKVAMRNIFLWYTMRAVSGYIPGMDKYQEAAVMALEGHNCEDIYPQCPASVVERIGRLSWTDFLPSDSQLKKLAGMVSHKAKNMGVPTNLDEVASLLEKRYGLVVKPTTMKYVAKELVRHWNKNKKNSV